ESPAYLSERRVVCKFVSEERSPRGHGIREPRKVRIQQSGVWCIRDRAFDRDVFCDFLCQCGNRRCHNPFGDTVISFTAASATTRDRLSRGEEEGQTAAVDDCARFNSMGPWSSTDNPRDIDVCQLLDGSIGSDDGGNEGSRGPEAFEGACETMLEIRSC